jgi:hypothetical protein
LLTIKINALHLPCSYILIKKVKNKEVMRLSNESDNGHGKYDPKVYYRHLGADVWEKLKPDEVEGEGKVAYSDELQAEFDNSDEQTEDNSQN